MNRTMNALAMLLVAASPALAQEPVAGVPERAAPVHIALAPEDLEWKPAPPLLPPGARGALLEGDPVLEGPFTIRLELPAGYQLPPHTHPGIERVTVLSGRFGIGVGETWDGERMRFAGPGGFFAMASGVAHFAMATEDTIVQIHSVGPWGLTYVNPADDPRGQQASSD